MAEKIDINLLREMIKVRRISLTLLSKLTNISKAHLSLMFNGRRNMTIDKLNIILEASNIQVKDIIRK